MLAGMTASPDPQLPDPRTPDLRVTVEASHLPGQSVPGRAFFRYVVRIENHAEESWQLLGREWRITDAAGRLTEVAGDGVVGQTPVLAPGAVYVYDSFVTVEEPPGRMSGHYRLRDAWGREARVPIPEFRLELPAGRTLN